MGSGKNRRLTPSLQAPNETRKGYNTFSFPAQGFGQENRELHLEAGRVEIILVSPPSF